MSVGDWVQSIVSFVGILATLVVAALVLRIERGDRAGEKLVEKKQADQAIEKRQAAEVERERRAVRREQHKEDYATVSRALAVLNKVFETVEEQPWTREQFDESGIEDSMEHLLEVSKRVPSLDKGLTGVWIAATNVTRVEFPSGQTYEFLFLPNQEREQQAAGLSKLMREAVKSGICQSRYAIQGQRAIASARQALAVEWGSE